MNLDSRLRETLTDERWALTGWPDATARVARGVTRRRRRRNLAIAGVAVAVALLVGVPALLVNQHGAALPPAHPSPPASPSPAVTAVPWLDQPGIMPTTGVPAARPTATPCTENDLAQTAKVVGANGAAGTQIQTIALSVVGTRRCTLAGSPTLLVRDGSGNLFTPPSDRNFPPPYPAGQEPATVDPGEAALVTIDTSLSCNGGIGDRVFTEVYLKVGAGRVRVDQLRLDYTCDAVSVGRWYRPTGQQEAPAPLTDAGITASIQAPASVAAGGRLEYVVTLANPNDSAVDLNPCPVYRQTFYKSSALLTLNCTQGPTSLAAHSSVSYAMRIQVPDYAPAGPAPLSWEIEEARGATATVTTQVTITTG